MSSPPQETETHEVTLSREERWVVHSLLADRIDEAVADDSESPPEWALEAIEAVEADGSDAFTDRQLRRLRDDVDAYLEDSETPQRDVEHGAAVLERVESALAS
ncbi:hypothetical protein CHINAEXTREME_01065 [Halobiforma lacisalsi AJ5]|uniref:Uncharacterized protein n=2 Tax=Natronobacterium TaxID=2256 RepID=M0LDX7_NATLA|nr:MULTISPECIES: hypothetical protein [Halobiforma]APW96438.1 hypothetical protein CHINAEXTREME_01065 [Halobiforma lacisalsi AJ5]EMA31791.1 hypothetical protein C445_13290 [Halobiforma lacisalsi AJ5]SFB70886.1 hypothetical protein SAMN05444422_101369 [Halobiforma haloterrestris]